jgi:glyceraldehyde-3-phosphate dehydrogenase/erythrose-4-phosphate dehydrogenase
LCPGCVKVTAIIRWYVASAAHGNVLVQVVTINNPFVSVKYIEYLLRHDTVYERFPWYIVDGDQEIMVKGKTLRVFREMDSPGICGTTPAPTMECTGPATQRRVPLRIPLLTHTVK